MADLIVDTDVFVDHLRGVRRLALSRQAIGYSVVTRWELFAGRGSQEETVRLLLAPFHEVAIDRVIAERAGRLRRLIGMRTPDALIAATALELGLPLVTRDVRDFAAVPRLRIRSPEPLAR